MLKDVGMVLSKTNLEFENVVTNAVPCVESVWECSVADVIYTRE